MNYDKLRTLLGADALEAQLLGGEGLVVLPLGTTKLHRGSRLISEPAHSSGSPTCGGLLVNIRGRYVPRPGSWLAPTGRARQGGPVPLRPSVTPDRATTTTGQGAMLTWTSTLACSTH